MTHTLILKGDYQSRQIWLNGKYLSPSKSQSVVNHSPDGFNWAYGGSGPAQLALAICMELGIQDSYQAFKWEIVESLPKSNFEQEFQFKTTPIDISK